MKHLIGLILLIYWNGQLFAHGMSEEAHRVLQNGGVLQYIWLGAEHMVTGYDHLLFLLGVIFFLRRFSEIVKFISIFTLGHSITLILATFFGISANYWLVDAVIALSVCYKGFDNIGGFQEHFALEKSPNLLIMVFIFGLIHGFGLATRLQQLPLGKDALDTLIKIIAFNGGVELGQIAALSAMLVLLTWCRRFSAFTKLSLTMNKALILAGFLLFLMQIHGYWHGTYPDEFGFNEDGHLHHHEYLDDESGHSHDSID